MSRRGLARIAGPAAAFLLAAACDEGPGTPPGPDPFVPETGHLPEFRDSPDNPLTLQGVDLGRRLFFDPILSGDGTQSCATCHVPEHAFSDPRRFSVGVEGSVGTRNAQPIINVAWTPELFWDGRAPSVEDQARDPVPDPTEMNLPWPDAEARVAAHPGYPALFEAA
ncbi:MAG TPA: cytochrome-c peroxidase, partial [bacterium]|nr:cytochrome-c peroxidase [bacterium]